MNSLKILPVKVKKEKNEFKKLPSILPRPPFLLTVQAPVRSGKSNLIMNMIYRWYKPVFDEIIFISPTVKNDKTCKMLYNDDDIIKIDENLEEDLDMILSEIVNQQNETSEDERKHILIILDDCLGFLKKGLANLCSRYRHYKISLIITSQSFRSIPVITRCNSSHYILFRTNNKKELDKLEEEFSGNFLNFIDLYKEATNEKYSFLYLDMENIKAYQCFTRLLFKK